MRGVNRNVESPLRKNRSSGYTGSMEDNPVWKKLEQAKPDEVCRKSGAVYDSDAQIYSVPSFSDRLNVVLPERKVTAESVPGSLLISEYREYFLLAVPAYLLFADGRPLAGELVHPKSISGGEIYRQGAHMLPLDKLAARFRDDAEGFLQIGRSLGGEPLQYGDASIRLFPFPHLPVHFALWLKDDEFPEQADLFFDSSCEGEFPPDVLWGIAAACTELMCRWEG
jgi:hypothetical protein